MLRYEICYGATMATFLIVLCKFKKIHIAPLCGQGSNLSKEL
jgi:hypothetical protein